MWLYTLLDYVGAFFFIVSLFALRQTVMAMVQGGRNTFSLFRNLQDREKISLGKETQLYFRAMLTTFNLFKGPERRD